MPNVVSIVIREAVIKSIFMIFSLNFLLNTKNPNFYLIGL